MESQGLGESMDIFEASQLITDKYSVRILVGTTKKPKSAIELSEKFGIPIAVAVALHNIPEGVAVALPIYYATKKRAKAFFYSFLTGMSEPLGALLAVLILYRFLSPWLLNSVLSAVAGIMVFISFDELLPEALAYKNRHLIIFGIFFGMLVMAASIYLI